MGWGPVFGRCGAAAVGECHDPEQAPFTALELAFSLKGKTNRQTRDWEQTGGFMLHRAPTLACIVLLGSLSGCASQAPASLATRPPATGCTTPPPLYPAEARRMRIQGTVVVSGAVEPDGTISSVQVTQSSGNALLDDAGVQAVRSTACAPFNDPKTGKATRVPFSRPFTFSIDGPAQAPMAVQPNLPPATLSYAERIRQRVKPNIVVDEVPPENIFAVVKVLLGPDGSVLRTELEKSSGVKSYDAAVLKAIERSDPLPLPEPGQKGTRTVRLTFTPT